MINNDNTIRNKLVLRSMTMTATIIDFEIHSTSTLNFYDVLSSNGWDHYPLMVTGPGMARCGCPRGELNLSCKHRRYAVAFLVYIDPEISMRLANLEYEVRELNQHLLNLIEGEAELDAYREMEAA
jgi:hypothetical protein